MTKERKTQIVTLAVLALVAAVVVIRKIGVTAPRITAPLGVVKTDPAPQDAIYNMLDAAREGSVAKYLASYTGQMEASLKQAVAESGDAAFTRYLKDSNAAIKGVAVMEPQALTDREVKIKVEYVYQDRNEIQFLYLEKTAAGWKIARVDAAERVKTLVPYGTPVQ